MAVVQWALGLSRPCYDKFMLSTRPVIQLSGCQPRNFASLMELYASNYLRLLRLAPDLDGLGGTGASKVAGAMDLYLTVVERFKYTTEILLTYRFQGIEGDVLEPNVQIRVYHDAHMAEAMSASLRHSHRSNRCHRGAAPTELERKWEINRFLQRWLGYCGRQGHLFLAYNACSPQVFGTISNM